MRANSIALAALLALHGLISAKQLHPTRKLGGNGSDPVIRTGDGERLCGPRYWFEQALCDAKIENFHWHDLRPLLVAWLWPG